MCCQPPLHKRQADEFVQFGEGHDMWMLGHTLVWHNQPPSFYWENKDGSPKPREWDCIDGIVEGNGPRKPQYWNVDDSGDKLVLLDQIVLKK